MSARIYQRMKNVMQSGKAGVGQWTLEYERVVEQRPDPLTGWAGSSDTRTQVRLTFPTREAAEAYAAREGIAYQVVPGPAPKLKLQSYADNFR